MLATSSRGSVAAGFEQVAAEFERNFTERDELGASFAVYRRGKLVVDLWGGIADRSTGRPWQADTVQIIFSGSKGLVATCLLLLLDRGQLSLDAPVSRYWPEFGAAGKEHILVRDIVSHTARLPAIEADITWRDATDDRRMAELLASQSQCADPRAAATYHVMTFGWLCGELVRRVDGRSVGRFFADEVAGPLGLELWIGLPPRLEPRVAVLERSGRWGSTPTRSPAATDPLARRIFTNPPRRDGATFVDNEPDWRAAEIPATNAIGTARSVARLYGMIDRLVRPETLELARQPLSSGPDSLTGRPRSFGIGFQLQTALFPLGPVPGAFGHNGTGGSRHGRWPEQEIGFSYAPNLLRDDPDDDRGAALLTALHKALVGDAVLGAARR